MNLPPPLPTDSKKEKVSEVIEKVVEEKTKLEEEIKRKKKREENRMEWEQIWGGNRQQELTQSIPHSQPIPKRRRKITKLSEEKTGIKKKSQSQRRSQNKS